MKQHQLTYELVCHVQTAAAGGKLSDQEKRDQVLIGRLPGEMLKALGTPDLEVVTSVAIIDKIIFDHGVTAPTVARLHELISAPSAVYRSASPGQVDSVVVLTLEVVRSLPVIAAIKLNKPDSAGKGNIHWLASAYPKDHVNMFNRWRADGLLIWEP